MRRWLRRWRIGWLALATALLSFTTLSAQGPFSAQIQAALRASGLVGTGFSNDQCVVWSTAQAKFIPGTCTSSGFDPTADQTITGTWVFNDHVLTVEDGIDLNATGVRVTGADGVLTLLGLGNGADESLTIDVDNAGANVVAFGTGTGATTFLWNTTNINDFAGLTVSNANTSANGSTFLGLERNTLGLSLHSGNDAGGQRSLITSNLTAAGLALRTINAQSITFITNSDDRLSLNASGHWIPGTSNTYDLGSAAAVFREVFSTTLQTGATGVDLSGADGVLTLLGLGDGADESLTIDLDNAGANVVALGSGTGVTSLTWPGGFTAGTSLSAASYLTATNCADSAGDAACGAASAGAVVVDAADTTTVVSTTAVTANSQIFIEPDMSLGTRLSVTCNATPPVDMRVTARTAATSFTITVTGPVANPLCVNYRIVN